MVRESAGAFRVFFETISIDKISEKTCFSSLVIFIIIIMQEMFEILYGRTVPCSTANDMVLMKSNFYSTTKYLIYSWSKLMQYVSFIETMSFPLYFIN